MSVTSTLTSKGLVTPPKFVPPNVHYETEVGSVAYGVSQASSDIDVYGFCVPPAEVVFGHLRGEVPGFGRQKKRFDQYQQHGVEVGEGDEQLVYDLTIYAIPRYFHLCMENNPNMLESLFTPARCVKTSTPIAARVREQRRLFLHRGSWHKFRGFAYSQIHKMKNKNPEGKRAALVEEFGFDVKFAYHAVRLMDEAEQILRTGDLDLEASRERLIAIRQGEWTQEQVIEYFERKEAELDEVYQTTELIPHSPDEEALHALLLECLEEAWGSLDGILTR